MLDELGARSAPLLGSVQADPQSGLSLLTRGDVLAAGCHGDAPPPASGDGGRLSFLHLARRELGLAFPRGKRVRAVSYAVCRRLAGRPSTAGIRACFDAALRRDGVDPVEANRGATLHRSHCDTVMAVVRGDADVALASRAWATRAGLGFFGFAAQGYAYRRRLADNHGYDASAAGELKGT